MNALRKVKTFIKDEGHADFYPGFKINFISGKPPELVCFKADEEVERINLSKMETQEIHDLVKGKGYKRVMPKSLAAKATQGGEVTEEDWATYLEARGQRNEARREWEADALYRRLDDLDARTQGNEPKIGASGMWLVARKKDELQNGAVGVQYRNSMDSADRAPEGHKIKWGLEVHGVLEAEGWVKVVDGPTMTVPSPEGWAEVVVDGKAPQYLPTMAGDVRILRYLGGGGAQGAGAKSDEL